MNSHSTELIVALDFPRSEEALELVDELGDLPVIYKVGSELFVASGPDFVRELVHRKKRVFLDLKLHDIPNTVARAVRQIAFMQVEMFTVHLSGGSQMIKAAAEILAEIPSLRPKILGVSVLTSFDDVRWAEVTRALTDHAVDVDESVYGIVSRAAAWGADGIVCSALELAEVRRQFPGLYTVVPGIRMENAPLNDQSRVVTPLRARELGAHAIVAGRPITEAADPAKIAREILEQISAPRDELVSRSGL